MDDIEDNYEHLANGFFYITTRIKGPGGPDLEEFYSTGCQCEDNSPLCENPQNCQCQSCSDPHYYSMNDAHRVICNFESSNFITECHNACLCRSRKDLCRNRLIQRGPRKYLRVLEVEEKGLGVFTTSSIFKGEYICEYAGEVIGEDEAMRRIKANNLNGRMNYVLILNEHFGEITCREVTRTCIDPSEFGNIGRFINHSCSPNSFIMPVRSGCPVPHICIFALTDILPGEEITFDYGGQGEETAFSRIPCKCLSKSCRKWLPGMA